MSLVVANKLLSPVQRHLPPQEGLIVDSDLAPEKRTSWLMGKNQFKEKAMSETKRRAKYTLEFKLEAVR